MKHKKKQMSLEDVVIHVRIEEKKTRDKAKRAKELSSKENVVEEIPRPKFNRPERQNTRTKPNSSNKIQNPTFKKKGNFFVCGKSRHYAPQCPIQKDLRKSTQGQI